MNCKALLSILVLLWFNPAIAQVGHITDNVVVAKDRSTTISIFYPSEAHQTFMSFSDLSFMGSPDGEKIYWETFFDVSKELWGETSPMNQKQFARSLIQASSDTKLPVKNSAAPSKKNAPYPVLLYSPGFGLSRNSNYSQVLELVKADFIVVTVDHPNTGIPSTTLLTNGEVVHCSIDNEIFHYWSFGRTGKISPKEANKGWKKIFELRLKDIKATIDHLASLEEKPLFKGVIDLGKVGVFGQSNGGATAVISLLNDDRIDSAVNMDGSLFRPMIEYKNTAKPLLTLFANMDDEDVPVKEAVENGDMNADFAKNAVYKEMKRFEHVDFTSIRLLERHLNFDLTLTDYHSPDPQAANAALSLELIKFFRESVSRQN